MDIEGERDELRDILDETKIQSESLNKELAEKQVGFDFCNIQLSDYNFTSVSCEKSASSLTLPNPAGFPLHVLWFPPTVTTDPGAQLDCT
jgi:hypothetical protein